MGEELVSLELIDANPWQPRTYVDPVKVAELAESIREHGLLQAPAGRRLPGGRGQLAFGHRRAGGGRARGRSLRWVAQVDAKAAVKIAATIAGADSDVRDGVFVCGLDDYVRRRGESLNGPPWKC